MPILYLMRHGIAEDGGPTMTDDERELTDEGRRKTTAVARGLQELEVAPQVILSSPLVRAWQTAEIAARTLGVSTGPQRCPALAIGSHPESVAKALQAHRTANQILLVGHQPSMGELASYLLTGSTNLVPLPFKKAAVAAIEVASVPPRSSGVLCWFLTPNQLRLIGD